MKTIYVLLVLLLLWSTTGWSQIKLTSDPQVEEDLMIMPESWFIELNYHNVFDDNFSSDAITGDAGWYIITNQDASWPGIWDDALLDIGPIVGLKMNSGIESDQKYSENIILWTIGTSLRLRYSLSQLTLNLQGGQLIGKFNHLTGFERVRKDAVWSAEIIYESNAGRLQGQFWLTAWQMRLIGSTPWSPQVPLDWGFNELTHNVGEGATNTYSVHASASLDIFDIPMSDIILLPISIKGSGGKYNENIKYFGLGFGLGVLVNNRPAVGLYLEKLWGWDNSKFDNWNLNFKFHLSFFETIWWNTTGGY
ncbi:hypothetical protein COT94_04095 [Candidatus Falkowbacteria bacterium CG10_big_fil_rev_8_21_14_0_10_37_14]|uniref:Uncharacterized protein n=1 Tax=Candidatus Falkowbacteria bacterium CG10_big_fil_rev_8_21_14_0_10_37_14 TaxID=1974561 RepID=A0A2M6WSJ2_9BACT|nr:hypothetical protein [Candidatus Falkowbacteria bacterium]PIT95741.1 MAG: hypothetical protein COT94_04095 [Candidatus Falkowbacteria bacterium CG10_big_fil_rev_8_21_14_0_10_37_14]